MSKNHKNIQQSIRAITDRDVEIISAVVISIDEDAATMEARTSLFEDADTETITVTLNAISNNNNGCILYPAINSNVVIGNVDGPGEYTLIRASDITKAVVKIGDQVFTMDGNKYAWVKGGESFGKIMSDLMDKILAMTFTNGAGTTSPPNNTGDLTPIKTRLTNFLIS